MKDLARNRCSVMPFTQHLAPMAALCWVLAEFRGCSPHGGPSQRVQVGVGNWHVEEATFFDRGSPGGFRSQRRSGWASWRKWL